MVKRTDKLMRKLNTLFAGRAAVKEEEKFQDFCDTASIVFTGWVA